MFRCVKASDRQKLKTAYLIIVRGLKKFIDSFKFFNVFLQKNLDALELCADRSRIILQQLLIYRVFVVSTLLFGFNNTRFNQDLHMMADGGLCQINDAKDLRTRPRAALFGKMVEYLESVCIPEGTRNFFNLF